MNVPVSHEQAHIERVAVDHDIPVASATSADVATSIVQDSWTDAA